MMGQKAYGFTSIRTLPHLENVVRKGAKRAVTNAQNLSTHRCLSLLGRLRSEVGAIVVIVRRKVRRVVTEMIGQEGA